MSNTLPMKPPRTVAGLPVPLYSISGFTTFDAFAQYSAQALVTYYIYFAVADGGLALPTAQTIAIISAWVAISLLGTVFTAWLVDRVIGAGLGLRSGAIISAVGYLVLAFVPGTVGLAVGLILLTLAPALTLASEGTLASGVMEASPSRREAGFAIFYLGSALGAFIGFTVSGFLQEAWGFQIGFIASAVVISVGYIVYLPSRRAVEANNPRPPADERPRGLALILPVTAAVVVTIGLAIMVSLGINPSTVISIGTGVYVIAMFVRYFTSQTFTRHERQGVARYVPFFIATIAWNLIFQQIYTTIAIYSDLRTDRFLFGLELPAATVLGVAPLCVVVAAPIFAAVWAKLGERQPSLAVKFAFTFACCGIAMGVLAASSLQSVTPILVLALLVLVFGVGDVVVSPSGMSLATEIAPTANESRMLSLHYVGASLGISLAGVAGDWFDSKNPSAYFGAFSAIAFAVALGMVIVRAGTGRRVTV